MRGSSVVVEVTRWLLIVVIALQSLVLVGYVLGPHRVGMNLPTIDRFAWPGHQLMSAEGILAQSPEVDIDLSWKDTENGTVDANTGLPPVSWVGHFRGWVQFWSPDLADRVAFVGRQVAGSLIAIGVMWLLLRMVSSVGKGSPFTEANARRVWLMALIVGVGGTALAIYSRWLDNWLIAKSAAAPAFVAQSRFSLVPLAVGLVLAVLAVAWTRGVELQRDSEGLV